MTDAVCFTCEIVDEYVGLANDFTQDLSHALVGPMWVLFLSLVGLWAVIEGLRVMLHQTTLIEFAKEFVFVLIAAVLLSGIGPDMVNKIYGASLKMMGSAASVALTVGQQETSAAPDPGSIGGGMTALVQAAETGVTQVFGMAAEIASTATLTNPLPIVYALALIVPYFLVLIVYFSQVVVSIFRIIMLATLSPYLMLGYGFGWGRDMAKAGLRTMLTAFMVLFGATAALSIMLYAVTGLEIGDPAYDTDGLSITDTTYLLALAMGWLGTAFMTEATGMANSISQSSLTNTAAGVITAGAAGTAMALMKGPAGAAQKFVRGAADAAGWQWHQSLSPSYWIGNKATELVQKARKE